MLGLSVGRALGALCYDYTMLRGFRIKEILDILFPEWSDFKNSYVVEYVIANMVFMIVAEICGALIYIVFSYEYLQLAVTMKSVMNKTPQNKYCTRSLSILKYGGCIIAIVSGILRATQYRIKLLYFLENKIKDKGFFSSICIKIVGTCYTSVMLLFSLILLISIGVIWCSLKNDTHN